MEVESTLISEYFDPDVWNRLGQNAYVTIKKTYNELKVYTWRTEYMDISQNTCSFFNNRYFDLSQFDLFYGGDDCTYYFLD